jgi:hypothetical protein
MSTSPESKISPGRTNRRNLLWLAYLFFVIIFLIAAWHIARLTFQHKLERARTAWKTATLSRLAGMTITNEEIKLDLERLQNRGAGRQHVDWVSGRILLMTNNEYLIYSLRHGFNDGSLDHLFLAHGSNGRWYYSTYHFCNEMVGVMDDPPGSIDEFARKYSAVEFDGKSDDCLKKTWPHSE